MKVEENISLRLHTSLHVGGLARYFIRVKSDEDAVEALRFAKEKKLPFFVLGKGSNTLFPDKGFGGVILHMEDRTLSVEGSSMTAAAGVFMRQLVTKTHEHGLVGLEALAGIPGTVGGAVRGNAGTWQTETSDHLTSVEVLQPHGNTWELVALQKKDCVFGYRDSLFKHQPNWAILRAHFTLTLGDTAHGQALVAKDLRDRHERQPYDAPSAGSVFKNPDTKNKLFSGGLIEMAGLKGFNIGGAEISTKHANFIVNRSNKATSSDVLAVLRHAQKTVREKFGIELEPEIVIVD